MEPEATHFFENQTNNADAQPLAPPYMSFRVLDDFLSALNPSAIPSHLTPEGLAAAGNLSDEDGRLLVRTLRFLGFVSDHNMTTANLLHFVRANPSDQQQMLQELVRDRYSEQVVGFLANDDRERLGEYFEQFGTSKRVQDRRISFLIRFAEKAGLPVSPRQKMRKRPMTAEKISLASPQPAQASSVETQDEGPMVTHLTLGWRRNCTLTHDFELTKSDIRKIGKLLKIITDQEQETDDPEA